MKAKPSLDLRSRIIDAAGKLFAEHGYQSVSMRRVADLAGCSQMAMYRHFKDPLFVRWGLRALCDACQSHHRRTE
jgi:AraC-like DNA-binding protein